MTSMSKGGFPFPPTVADKAMNFSVAKMIFGSLIKNSFSPFLCTNTTRRSVKVDPDDSRGLQSRCNSKRLLRLTRTGFGLK